MHGDRRNRNVEKKVFFYRLFVDGTAVQRANQFDFTQVARSLRNLPYSENGRYEADEDDAIISCFVDGDSALRFGRIRRSNLPSIAQGARIRAITVPPDAGLFECCHVRYFGSGIVGAEFNNYAPRVPSRLPGYISRKANVEGLLELRHIMRDSPLDAFRRFRSVRAVTVKVATAEHRALANAGGGLIAQIAAVSGRQGIESVEFTLSASRGRARPLGADIVNAIQNVLRMPNVRETVDRFTATGYFANRTASTILDLLEDDLVVSKQFLRESLRTKTLETADAYEKLGEAYNEVRDFL